MLGPREQYWNGTLSYELVFEQLLNYFGFIPQNIPDLGYYNSLYLPIQTLNQRQYDRQKRVTRDVAVVAVVDDTTTQMHLRKYRYWNNLKLHLLKQPVNLMSYQRNLSLWKTKPPNILILFFVYFMFPKSRKRRFTRWPPQIKKERRLCWTSEWYNMIWSSIKQTIIGEQRWYFIIAF